jgi:transcription antitermination protein NusB
VAPAAYAVQLVTGLSDRLDEVDALVDGHSSGWAIGRMPAVDRSILRLATYELLSETDVPVAVVIDEAVELAKEYSTEDSPRFVNGVLAAVAASVRPGGPDADGAPAPAGAEGADEGSQAGGVERG